MEPNGKGITEKELKELPEVFNPDIKCPQCQNCAEESCVELSEHGKHYKCKKCGQEFIHVTFIESKTVFRTVW